MDGYIDGWIDRWMDGRRKIYNLPGNREENAPYLLCHHRQHFQLNTVELIKTGPRSTGRQTFEKLETQRMKTALNFGSSSGLKK